MVIKDCIECPESEIITIGKTPISKCNIEKVYSMNSKCIMRKALIMFLEKREERSIHLINKAKNPNFLATYRNPFEIKGVDNENQKCYNIQDRTGKCARTEDSNSAGLPAS